MRKLTFMTCATAVALCLAGGPQLSLAQEERDQEQQDQNQLDEEQQRDQGTQQQRQEQQRREQQQREREAQQRQRQQDQERQSQFDQQIQPDQRIQDQRGRQDQQFQEDQRFGQDQQFGQQGQFQGRAQQQQQIELGARLQESGDRLVISDIRDQSLAARAGLRAQDVIVSVDGRTIRTPDQFQQILVTSQRQGGQVPVVIIRDGQRQTVYLDVDRRGQDDRRFGRDSDFYGGEDAWLGVILDPRYEDYTVVRRVYPGSAADEAGIREGDWIVAISNRRVQSPGHLAQIIGNMRPGEQINIQVARRVTRTLDARLGDMSERVDDGQFARGEQDRIQDRRSDQRSQFQTDDGFRSGYRGVDEGGVFIEEDSRQDQNRGLRDRFNPDQERGLRDRLDRDQDRDRPFDNRDQ